MEAIPLAALLPAGLDPTMFKVHFAVWDGNKQPIDVLATNQVEWQGWNSWRSVKDDFNRELIFSVAQDKTDPTLWLFGGIWEVLTADPSSTGPPTPLPAMTVSSIPEEPFAGDPFPGHDRIHDKETGQRYVGSAHGDTGVWQRWATYAATLHGGNVGLKELVEEKGEEYHRTNMRFALLEYWSMRTDDDHVLERESYWKEVLHARSLGHNKN